MRKNSFQADKCIAALNNAKKAMQLRANTFSKEEIIRTLKGAGIPSNWYFLKALISVNILQKVGRDKYMFTSKDPIFVEKLANAYKEYSSHINKKPEVVETAIPVKVEESDIEAAIKLLKENGYHILSPIGILYKEF